MTFVGFQLNCATETANNSSQTNANLPLPTAETNQASNVNAVAQETPLPTFTNADEALEVGKKLLDDLEAEKAVEALRQAVTLNPDLADAHFNLGIAYALLEKVEENNPPPVTEPTPTPVKKGKKEIVQLTASQKSFENAVKAYKKILAKDPKDDAAHYNLGRSYNKLNQDPEALKSLQQAVKLKPDDGEYQTELGVILIKLAQYEEAVAALKKAVSIDNTNLQAENQHIFTPSLSLVFQRYISCCKSQYVMVQVCALLPGLLQLVSSRRAAIHAADVWHWVYVT